VVSSQTGLSTNSFTPATNLADGKYRIWVNATNAAGTSAYSSPFDFDVGAPVTVPAAPTVTGTSDSGLGASRPQINWNAVSGATTYGVYLVNLDTGAVVSSQTGLSTNSFTPATNLADARYRIWVNARNAAGTSAYSSPFDFSIGGAPTSAPAAPTGLSASNTNTSTPTISWQASAGASKYAIWFVNLDTGTLVSGAENLTTTSFTPGSALLNGHYRFFVRAYNSIGSSAYSSPYDFVVAA